MKKLHIKAIPNARSSQIVGWEEHPTHGRVLRVRIAAPPVEDKANTALRVFLADQLGMAKSQIVLEKGGASRIKTFLIPDHVELLAESGLSRALDSMHLIHCK
jgi:uncharacterized protein